jgi:hypothetical protein
MISRIRGVLVQERVLPFIETILEQAIALTRGVESNENHALPKQSIVGNVI